MGRLLIAPICAGGKDNEVNKAFLFRNKQAARGPFAGNLVGVRESLAHPLTAILNGYCLVGFTVDAMGRHPYTSQIRPEICLGEGMAASHRSLIELLQRNVKQRTVLQYIDRINE